MTTDTTNPPRLPERDPHGHKGTFGTVAVLGGCCVRGLEEDTPGLTMVGGPALAALGALRTGCGLAKLVMPEPILAAGLTIAPSATGVPLAVDHDGAISAHKAAFVIDAILQAADCLAIGPGLGLGDGPRAAALRAVVQADVPVVVDADAINNLADIPELHRDFHAPAVLTPHPGEYRRLAAALNLNTDPADAAQRPAAAEQMAQRLGCVVVLKGAGTVVSDGQRTWVHAGPAAANPALATAGTGDVLAGVIASLIAQHHRRPIVAGERTVTSERLGGLSLYDCARLGVSAHAEAALIWAAEAGASAGLLAADLAAALPAALESLRPGRSR
jgi:NAD(P)H-hydrate epimerase